MALSLKDAETDQLAREVAKLTGESLTKRRARPSPSGSSASGASAAAPGASSSG